MLTPIRMGAVALVVALLAPAPVLAPASATEVPTTDGESPLLAPGVANVAHKGASADAPENTLAALRLAAQQGANFVGIDVHRTRDNYLVVLHDQSLARTTNVEKLYPRRSPWLVRRFTLAEVKRLDAGSWFGEEFRGERVPTLGQVLREMQHTGTGLFLEIKAPALYGWVDGVGTDVVRLVRRQAPWMADPTNGRLVVQAFDDDFLHDFAQAFPAIVTGALGPVAALSDYEGWASQINVHHRDVTAELVNAAKAADLAVSTYVVNDPEQMRRVVQAGVDAVSTDYPGVLMQELRGLARVMVNTPPSPSPTPTSLMVSRPTDILRRARVPVRAELSVADGGAVSGAWVTVERRRGEAWLPLRRRRTNDAGVAAFSLVARRGALLRFVSESTAAHLAAPPVTHRLKNRRARTRVELSGRSARRGTGKVSLRVRWRAEDGRRLTGRVALLARPQGIARWRPIRRPLVRDGAVAVSMRLRRTTRYQVRAPGGSWWVGDRDVHMVRH